MFQNYFIRKFWHNAFIAPAGKVCLIRNRLLIADTPVHKVGGRKIRLPRKYVYNGFCGVCLEFLMLELKF